jgi:hypothetical protein
MSHIDPSYDPNNSYKSEHPSKKEHEAYGKKLRGAVYKVRQENSLVGKLKKQIRSKKELLLGKKSE